MTHADTVMTMSPDVLEALRSLHERKRLYGLQGEEITTYRGHADRLLTMALARQEAQAGRAGSHRRSVRLRRAVPVDLQWGSNTTRCLTLDLGAGGFAVLLGDPPPAGQPLVAMLHLRRGTCVRAGVRLVKAVTHRGCVRASLSLIDVPQLDAVRLQEYLVEALLPASSPVLVEVDVAPQMQFRAARAAGR
jgi:hypothetical protein